MSRQLFRGVDLDQQKEPSLTAEMKHVTKTNLISFPDSDTEIQLVQGAEIKKNEVAYEREGMEVKMPFNAVYKGKISYPDKLGNLETYRVFANTDDAEVVLPIRDDEIKEDMPDPKIILMIAKDAGIVDEYDGVPLYKKLEALQGKDNAFIIADAVDDEPMSSSGIHLILHMPLCIARGLKLAEHAVGAEKGFALIYGDLDDIDSKMPHKIGEYKVKRIWSKYPARYLIPYKYPRKKNAARIGVGALYHLAAAVDKEQSQTTTFITVGGDAVASPSNVCVPLGTPVSKLLDECGLAKNPLRIILGGSMTGNSITDLTTPVTYTTRTVLAFGKDMPEAEYACIGCGKCVEKCPERLLPVYIYRNAKAGNAETCRYLRAQSCAGCGVCSYVCPSNMQLTQTIISIKSQLNQKDKEADEQ